MSQDKTLSGGSIVLRVAGAVALVLLAGGLGGLLGRCSAPNILPQQVAEVETETPSGDEAAEPHAALPIVPSQPPPLYLYLGIGPESVWEAIEEEVAHAVTVGLHRYIVPAPLFWDEDDTADSLAHLKRILSLDPEAEFMLQLRFNPPEVWFDTYPDARMEGVAGDIALPTPTSVEWLDASRQAFDQLHGRLQSDGLHTAVSGYVLQGLRQGRWQGGASLDSSAGNTAGFREWLRRNYADDKGLQKAWHRDDATLDGALPPEPSPSEEPVSAFLRLKEDAPMIDYARYRATSVAEAIGALASHVRNTAGESPRIWATYGYSFEMAESSNGHLAMGVLLDSDLDGFVAPVSLTSRGIGGTGGYMGPVHSAMAHGKSWIIVDDTRTGIEWNTETGQVDQMRGLRPEDVHNVQRRNFALAAVNGLSLAWSDPLGRGTLCSDAQWTVIGGLLQIYRNHVDYPGSRLEIARQTYPEDAPLLEDPTLLVVVDEAAQFLCNDAAGLASLLAHNRDEILRTGVSTEFCLLDDLLDNRTPQADIYLFLNAYSLPSEKREQLHQRFAEENAPAIWVYAPG
ncbi:MAG: hypothetical protein L3K26_18775, partial [Candidatus Hydrogenedentes bacterium]|nr:hypothetical protein [Candidatus Hydrogenedentota bacterium]